MHRTVVKILKLHSATMDLGGIWDVLKRTFPPHSDIESPKAWYSMLWLTSRGLNLSRMHSFSLARNEGQVISIYSEGIVIDTLQHILVGILLSYSFSSSIQAVTIWCPFWQVEPTQKRWRGFYSCGMWAVSFLSRWTHLDNSTFDNKPI